MNFFFLKHGNVLSAREWGYVRMNVRWSQGMWCVLMNKLPCFFHAQTLANVVKGYSLKDNVYFMANVINACPRPTMMTLTPPPFGGHSPFLKFFSIDNECCFFGKSLWYFFCVFFFFPLNLNVLKSDSYNVGLYEGHSVNSEIRCVGVIGY